MNGVTIFGRKPRIEQTAAVSRGDPYVRRDDSVKQRQKVVSRQVFGDRKVVHISVGYWRLKAISAKQHVQDRKAGNCEAGIA